MTSSFSSSIVILDVSRCCSSYPRENVVPKSYSDESLEKVAAFRSKCRFPSAVWRNRETGNVLLRSSQPFVGFFCQRSQEDEDLIQVFYCELVAQGVSMACEHTA